MSYDISNHPSLNYFQHRQVLVTGAAGFVGSHLVDALLSLGADLVGVDNLATGKEQNLHQAKNSTRFQFIKADVTWPPEKYLGHLSNYQFEAVFHLASPASPPRYQEQPVNTYLVNSFGTHLLLNWLHQTNPKARFLFASTSEVYGDPEVHPQPESYWGNVNPNGPRSCYDESKRLGEAICGVWSRDYNLDVRIVRIFNTYGPRLDPYDGRVVSNFITQAKKQQPLTIYGEGNQTRSYCYVSDLVLGLLLMMAKPDLQGQTINLGNPAEYTIRETASLIWSIINPGKKLKLRFEPLPKDDPTRRRPDISLAQKLLSWQPKVDFKTGIKKTIAYL